MATDAISNDPISNDPLGPVPVELCPVVDHLVTEDDTPVDGIFSEKQMRLLTEPLYSSWICPAGPHAFVATANVGLFFDVNRSPLVPDVLLSTNVVRPADFRPKRYRSYFTWQYGKPPDVVIDVVSNREGGEDTDKLKIYAEIGVHDYAIYDPERLLSPELLRVYRLVEGQYSRMDEPIWFPKVGLGLRVWQGTFEDWENVWLRWVDGEGTLIPTGQERADSQKQRVERAEQRAESAEQRAAMERQRADKLAEQLRQLGIEPA